MKAVTNEKVKEIETVIAKERQKGNEFCLRNTNGNKAAMVVSVDAIIGLLTSRYDRVQATKAEVPF